MATQAENPTPPIAVPEGYSLHTENTSHILLPNDNGAFLNPVQEFNRDMSVACIRTWGDQMNEFKKKKWEESRERKASKRAIKAKRQKTEGAEFATAIDSGAAEQSTATAEGVLMEPVNETEQSVQQKLEYIPQEFAILEALSATGLRSIRYAKEIPLAKYVIANDLSPSASEAMRRNVELNGLGPARATTADELPHTAEGTDKPPKVNQGKVRVNEGDACALMYNHRALKERVDVVDLDPYGTASPFIDAAVQCVNDGGLLCVTCTDLSVLATTNYPEKCYSNYGGIPVKAEYCHEAALRLLLHTVSTSAARYGRYIHPLLSLSIDFYIRVFIRVTTSPIDVKKAASKTSMYYVCSNCQSFYEQPLGRIVEKVSESSGNVNLLFKTHSGPPVSDHCPECNSTLHIAGPMWSGPIHDTEFIAKIIEHVDSNASQYGTSVRMKGMLTVAKEELHTPFYFTPSKVASFFHCECPPLDDVASALLHAGHEVSRSHACAGSLKTTAPRSEVHDIFRSWVKKRPVRMDKLSETSPARVLLAKEPKTEANFTHHPKSVSQSSKVKLVRYQQNPQPNWGPGSKAKSGTKRKREQAEE